MKLEKKKKKSDDKIGGKTTEKQPNSILSIITLTINVLQLNEETVKGIRKNTTLLWNVYER